MERGLVGGIAQKPASKLDVVPANAGTHSLPLYN
jgi:hypothetical protein